MTRPVVRTATAVAVGLLLAGCGGNTETPAAPPPLSGTLTVLAASSLSESFADLGRRFEADHPGLTVTLNFGASSSLARQLVEGAPGDVLATADETTIGQALDANAVRAPAVFARNRLAIVTRAGNPEGIEGLTDLARPDLVVVLCAREVPCGRLAVEALDKAGVMVAAASLEENVKAVLSKVTLGEADAGIVYVTDVAAARDQVGGVTIPAAHNVVASYPIAVATGAANPTAAGAWLDFVLGPTGQAILAGFGFAPASP